MANAQGYCSDGSQGYVMVDIPGCYSLMAHSAEEEVARDFICFEHPDAVVVVCDATCLERNLNLVLQVLEATPNAVVCVNLMDEAKKKRIEIRLDLLEERLLVPVAGTAARSKKGLDQIYTCLRRCLGEDGEKTKEVIDAEEVNKGTDGEVVERVEEVEAVEKVEDAAEEQKEEKTQEAEEMKKMKTAEETETAEETTEFETEEAEDAEDAEEVEEVEEVEETEEAEELEKTEEAEVTEETEKATEEETEEETEEPVEAVETEKSEKPKQTKNPEKATGANPPQEPEDANHKKEITKLPPENPQSPILIRYPQYIEDAISTLAPVIENITDGKVNVRWLCARLLDSNENLMQAVNTYLKPVAESKEVAECLKHIRGEWKARGIQQEKVSDDMASVFVKKAEYLCRGVVVYENQTYNRKDRKLDWLFTSKSTGFPIMFLVLLGIFWLTITGANYPSRLISNVLFAVEDWLSQTATWIGVPSILSNLLIHGVYRSLAWVVSVMLPPMAIFFPLFTLLEDFGYLPRVAFNLDRCFKRCSACGKQALTM
ncbi:FeoB small GTPase domain-containing protein [Lacrimispora sp.]|uniref:FeoB small GTPase domain-containing protein n=1 Tax=Lacrimispora sp. TaxID=2719234 RepID=UPI0028A75468|nr:FeoB small GTPase domain-containing protein [Lacrimispora sp.]